MSLRRTIIVTILLSLLIPTALSLLSGCDSTPDEPEFNNPFDPNGPNAGDPFELVATLGDTNITLLWNNIHGYDLVSYEVMHSLNFFENFFSIGTVEVPTLDIVNFTYQDPDPTSSHYFKIQAYDSQGNFTLTSHIVPASATTTARVVIGDGSNQIESRQINIRINVTNGDSLRISQSGHPDSEVVLPADESGDPTFLPWDLGPVDSNDTTLTILVMVQNGASLGDTSIVDLDVNFSPTLGLVQGGTKVAQLYPPLKMDTEGVVSMRFADSLENLENSSWVDPAPTYDQYQLVDTANPQGIHAEFLSDFGFSIFRLLTVRADLLTDVSFSLNLPADHITDVSTVQGICDANATLMRFNESLDFTSTPWITYSDTTTITISPEPGEKTIYAQFRNDFADSPILTDYVIHLVQPVEVAITAPAENDILNGGTILRIQGTATAPSGTAPVDLVMFDGGEGFIAATGTSNWSYMWEIPRFDADTNLTIRARAWAGDDSVTTTMNVVVSQLVIGINSPAEGDTVVSDTDVEISGFAFPVTGGAAIDSVVVEVDGVRGVAEGTQAWSFDWRVGVFEEVTEVVIGAVVYAGGGEHPTTQTIVVTPVVP